MTPLSGRRSHARHGARTINATVDAALAGVKTQKDAEWAAIKEASRVAEAARHRFTREEIADAKYVRTRAGWHRVVRVNAKSVTVETGYSWTDRIALEDIHETLPEVTA